MRRLAIVFIALICILSFTHPAYSGCGCRNDCASAVSKDTASDVPGGNPLQKLGRGLSNCITFIFEIPMQMGKTNVQDGPFASFTYGVLKGLGMAGLRAAVGVYEVATFPIPCPAGYKPILTDPEYMFEDQLW